MALRISVLVGRVQVVSLFVEAGVLSLSIPFYPFLSCISCPANSYPVVLYPFYASGSARVDVGDGSPWRLA